MTSENASAQTDTPASSKFRIGQAAMAIKNVDAMLDFYGNVFEMEFDSISYGELTYYSGMLAGLRFMLVPNEIAGVVYEQSPIQFDIIVPDLAPMRELVVANGGSIREEGENDRSAYATVLDPDGNTIVLVEDKEAEGKVNGGE